MTTEVIEVNADGAAMLTEVIKVNTDTQSKANGALIEALNWLYDQVSGTYVDGSTTDGPMSDAEIEQLIAYYCTGAGTAGFVTNVGGLLTLPVAVPANLLSVAALQLRLIATIASTRGYDPRSHEVRTLGLVCLTGNAAIDMLKEAGIQIGTKFGQKAIGQISGSTILKINQAVGFRLLTKAGSQGVVNLTKFVPIIGGLVGGTIDALATKAVGEIAKQVFKMKLMSETVGEDVDLAYTTPEGVKDMNFSYNKAPRRSFSDGSWFYEFHN